MKLEDAPVFREAATDTRSAAPLPVNLVAYDGAGRIFVWNSHNGVLHFMEVSRSDENQAAGLFAREHKTMNLSTGIGFQVRALMFNRTGQSLLLSGDKAMVVVDVVPQSSQVCRAGRIGDDIFTGRSLRILDVAWHPYSDSHIGVLSTDSVFRLFNLASDSSLPEQEYHLQIGLSSKPGLEAFSRPVSFSFGGEHFWDRFTVFILSTDASIHALCPVVPFGSVQNIASLKDLSKDAAQQSGSRGYSTVWLEIVFPDLSDSKNDAAGVVRARPQVPFEASLALQGPLPKIWKGDKSEEKPAGYATSILYSTAGEDSICTVSTKNGELLFYALADEVLPRWNVHSKPRLVADEVGDLLSVGMLVEPDSDETGNSEGQAPPALHLATIDLALPEDARDAGTVGMFSDPLIPEKFYYHHALGLDTVQLQWLPFSDQSSGKATQAPLVSSVLDTSPPADSTPMPLLGATVVLDGLGATWLVAVTASGKCAVVEMKSQKAPTPLLIEAASSEQAGKAFQLDELISPDLLHGPKDISIPQLSSSTPLTVNMVEGRAALHNHGRLLHEKYIEYAHRVHVELKSHYKYLGDMLEDEEKRVRQAVTKVLKAEEESKSLVLRIQAAFEKNRELQDRVRECNKLPSLRQRVLTTAEREFKSLLDCKVQQDVDILQNAVESLSLRGQRIAKKKPASTPSLSPGYHHRSSSRSPKVGVPESQMRAMRLALDRLGQYLELGKRRSDVLEQTIKRQEAALEL